MKKLKILYLFRRPVKENMHLAQKGKFPHDYFFGYTYLSKDFDKYVTDRVFSIKLILAAEWQLQNIIRPLTKVSFSIISVLRQLDLIINSEVVFATVDSYGLPLSFLKAVNVVKKPLVIYTGGLCDEIIYSKSKLYTKIIRYLFSKVNYIISGNQYECQKIANLLMLPKGKFIFIPYSIDTTYFSPSSENKIGNYILAVGADYKRDWSMHLKIAKLFPKIKFIIITSQDSTIDKIPPNVEMFRDLPIAEVRDRFRKCMFVIVFSQQNSRFAGQSTIFRAMACAKPVIFTKSYGVETYPGLVNYQNCIMVPTSDLKLAQEAIEYLIAQKKRITLMGENARKFIVRYADYNVYTKRLEKIFVKSYKENL